jgi:mannosylglycoprotein endo-beta-mannosidase
MTRSLVVEMLGPRFGDNFITLPAEGTRGGVLIACTADFQITAEPLLAACTYSITGNILDRADLSSWAITGVYGPQEDDLKREFMQEVRQVRNLVQDRWMVLGDFNLISSATDKSNSNINLRLMGQFRDLIQDLELIDYPLIGRKFTWSSTRDISTHTRIDRVLVSRDWDLAFPQFQLTPASSNVSDHCPMLLSKMECKHYPGFRFEAHWLQHDDFASIISMAWEKPFRSTDAIRVLHTKLCRTAKALRKWNRGLVRWAKMVSGIADEVIFSLDVAQEDRELSGEEKQLRPFLKSKLLGIAAIDRIKWRQWSRITWIHEGNANTRLFHLRANGHRQKNHIPSLVGPAGLVTGHEEKEQILLNHFSSLMGSGGAAAVDLNWEALNVNSSDLSHLEGAFSLAELKTAIDDMHVEKAPGPDGFIGGFYKKCWAIVNHDLLAAMNQMHCLKGDHWRLLNTASIVLLPKRNEAVDAKDYRPVSLMHSAAKILCKLLANRLAPELSNLVSSGQIAFIKGRSIQDNFFYVRNVIKKAHKRKAPLLFLKLDIAKAFDSLKWGFLLQVLSQMGFGQRWQNMLSLILGSSSSRILLNGSLGQPFYHKRGFR